MADPITFRPTDADVQNLAVLTEGGGSPTHAIREALEVAAHERRQAAMRADAERLMNNPEYIAEVRAAREDMSELSAW